MTSRISELFGLSTGKVPAEGWAGVVSEQRCPHLSRVCIKVRKSTPDVSIGSCVASFGKMRTPLIICPHRFLERQRIFFDSQHLLSLHQPGNDLHVVSEQSIPGGNVDYFLVSAKKGKVKDFVGIEIQGLDTTGSIWPHRQKFLKDHGVDVDDADLVSKGFGVNWKMTAKTTLVQLHHKVETFEHLGKHLVLACQDELLAYMEREFEFATVNSPAVVGDSMHFHAYGLERQGDALRIGMKRRLSTDAAGVAKCLGLKVTAKVELEQLVVALEAAISDDTLLLMP